MAGFGTMRKVPKGNLAVSKPVWWLQTRMHFAFADYYNPDNIRFGALRVLNDDLVAPGGDFGKHLHRDAEIFTYVLQGELSHRKAGAAWEALARGSVQYFSAGTGTHHEEANRGAERLRYVQVWLTPSQAGRVPQYSSAVHTPEERHNRLLHILAGRGPAPAWKGVANGLPAGGRLHADVNVYVSECDPGTTFELRLDAGRQLYVLCMEGAARAAGTALAAGDALEVQAPQHEDFPLALAALDAGAHLLLVEMARSDE